MSHTSKLQALMAGTGLLLMAGPAFSLDGADLLAKINAAFNPLHLHLQLHLHLHPKIRLTGITNLVNINLN